jgi:hypothetical protein
MGSMWERTEPNGVGGSVVFVAERFQSVGDGVDGTVRRTEAGTAFGGRTPVLPMCQACAIMTATLNGHIG